jgi:hypothetical protein
MEKIYLVALIEGGHWGVESTRPTDHEYISASSIEEAEMIYNTRHNCSYYYGRVLAYREWKGSVVPVSDYVTLGQLKFLKDLDAQSISGFKVGDDELQTNEPAQVDSILNKHRWKMV